MNPIELENVSCGYNRQDVLKQVSLGISPGTVLVLLGPNGSGKTTLLRALFHLVEIREGSVLIEGESLVQMTRRRNWRWHHSWNLHSGR